MINNDFCVQGGTYGGNGRGTPIWKYEDLKGEHLRVIKDRLWK